MFSSIDAGQAIAKMSEGWEPYFIDVRSQEEWQQARIMSRVSPLTEICPHLLNSRCRDVLVQCRSMRSSSDYASYSMELIVVDSTIYGWIIGWA